jgi:hypothetical protein
MLPVGAGAGSGQGQGQGQQSGPSGGPSRQHSQQQGNATTKTTPMDKAQQEEHMRPEAAAAADRDRPRSAMDRAGGDISGVGAATMAKEKVAAMGPGATGKGKSKHHMGSAAGANREGSSAGASAETGADANAPRSQPRLLHVLGQTQKHIQPGSSAASLPGMGFLTHMPPSLHPREREKEGDWDRDRDWDAPRKQTTPVGVQSNASRPQFSFQKDTRASPDPSEINAGKEQQQQIPQLGLGQGPHR